MENLNNTISVDDLYFKDVFTETENGINMEANELKIGCITSKNNKFHLDNNGNLSVNRITAVEGLPVPEIDRSEIFNMIYPVGSIYMSVNGTNPSTLFGGTWTQLKDRFLIGTGDSYTNGATGGASTVTLSVAQMPAHTHTTPNHTHTFSGSVSGGGHSHESHFIEALRPQSSIYAYTLARPNTSSYDSTAQITTSDGSHSHSYSGTTSSNNGGNTGNAGSTQAHNNMPPYLAVYMWKRTA